MCRAMAQEGRFVPELCPLLLGLPPEEAARAMVDNPHIRACVEAFTGESEEARDRWVACEKSLEAAWAEELL